MSQSAPVSRRQLLTGHLLETGPEVHISSLVVHVRSEKLESAKSALLAMDEVEIHAEAGGKLVVTLETASESDIVTRLNEISLLEGVLSAALVFHQSEPAGDPESPTAER